MKYYLLTQLTFPRLANSRRSNNDNDADDDDDTSGDNSVKAYRKSVSKSKREHNMRNKDGDEISIEFFEEEEEFF
ncbi:hypothetical protein T07_3032 [Trichinella nelsoni]|uniref:Uncharacterized protein n=1 Tax=Trichinella nelsoni TaxID=6336 RepID=A0A0V0RT58_9BILA|nr:hypothetical protein T07_3032 [Trichinella nelsoni]